MYRLLDQITQPNDIKDIPRSEYEELAKEIRKFLVNNVSKTGGHLASNLGVVELTMALHLVLDLPQDKIIWDVGHQSYVHKILTGRKNLFGSLRKYNGLSGFPKQNESECDSFDTGHSSTSVSAGLGMAVAQELDNDSSTIVVVIGDGALTGGMAFEALNNLSSLKRNFIIILNDNNMSISENVGGMSQYLNKIRVTETYNDLKVDIEKSLNKIPGIGNSLAKKVKRTKDSIKQLFIPGGIFDDLGITYVGPVNGHDVDKLIKMIGNAKKIEHPVLIHVMTKKGYGYKYAMQNPAKFHGVAPFDKKTGSLLEKSKGPTFTDVFSKKILELAKEDEDIVAITAAMPDGTGLNSFRKKYPERFFDVGIAEEHAVTFAAGLANAGKKPYVAIYSSFYQRAYDQIIHDVCLQNLSVRLMIDRAGLVGRDGETHQGIFDIGFLSQIPNMCIISPMSSDELIRAMDYSLNYDGPIAIRYPRGKALSDMQILGDSPDGIYEKGAGRIVKTGDKKIAIITVGTIIQEAIKASDILAADGIMPTIIDARFLKPLSDSFYDSIFAEYENIIVVEEAIKTGGFGERLAIRIVEKKYSCKFLGIAINDIFVKQGGIAHLRKKTGLDAESIAAKIKEFINP